MDLSIVQEQEVPKSGFLRPQLKREKHSWGPSLLLLLLLLLLLFSRYAKNSQ